VAFREVRVIEVREVLRAWLAGAGRKLGWQGTGWAEPGGGRPATAAGPDRTADTCPPHPPGPPRTATAPQQRHRRHDSQRRPRREGMNKASGDRLVYGMLQTRSV
jgi:hypothetical protein